MRSAFTLLLVTLLLLPISAAVKSKSPKIPKPLAVKTHATVMIHGQKLAYTATAGRLLLYDAKHKATASVFYIAYTLDGADASQRPITFAYNGGPGGASALVDIGGFGPRRIAWPAPGSTAGELPPYQLVNNGDSIFNATDLVFIDAVGTGYSRIVGQGKPKMFYGIAADGQAFAQFIRRYVAQNGRWNSPKFLLGESYGTTRNAVVAEDLVRQGMYLNGVIMCSTVLDFPTVEFTPGNDMPYDFYLPSYAAVAWYHHRLHPQPASLPAWVKRAETFAAGSYAQALYQGSSLPAAQKQAIATQLSQFTGIPAALWLKADLRMKLSLFMRRLLGPTGPMTGRYDGRFTTLELQPILPFQGNTASGATTSAIWGALSATFDQYVRQDLHYPSHRFYQQLNFAVNRQWKWQAGGDLRAENVAPALARAMNNDPGMQVMFNNGYFDMATPFFATHYTITHMGLPPQLQSHIHVDFYDSGHMLYLNPQALAQVQRNMDAFIRAADGGR
ncbi:MAG: S10 family peptidase [Terriglobales bacterium]